MWLGNETSNAVLQLVSFQREKEPTAVRWLVLSWIATGLPLVMLTSPSWAVGTRCQ